MYVEVFFLYMILKGILETFRFKDENDYEYEIFRIFSKYRLPGKLHFTIFH